MKKLFVIPMLSIMLTACTDGNSKSSFVFKKAPKAGVVAKFDGVEISEKELVAGQESDIYEAERKVYEIKFANLKNIVMKKLIAKDEKSKGMTEEEYIAKFIEAKIQITEKDVEAFIKEKNIPKEQVNDMIKERIKMYLKLEKKTAAIEQWFNDKTKDGAIEVYLEKPQMPVFDVQVGNAPVWGDKDAKVTIVEYSDFQCPFCAKGAELMTQVKKAYKGKVKIAFKHFPLPFHTDAEPASVASMCVHELNADKFWDYHDKLFANQTDLKPEGLTKIAKLVGVDEKKFSACLSENRFAKFVKDDLEAGKKLGVKSTPTFYVNGKLVSGAQPFEVFKELIDEELSH